MSTRVTWSFIIVVGRNGADYLHDRNSLVLYFRRDIRDYIDGASDSFCFSSLRVKR